MKYSIAIELVFTDAAGLHWVRRVNGRLEQLDRNPFEGDPKYTGFMYGIGDTRVDIIPVSPTLPTE